MKIYSVSDPEFRPYGKVLTGYDTSALVAAMQTVPMPERGTAYEPAIEALETCGIFDAMQNRAYGGLPIQIGMCWGYNTKLNCLEYHRDSEINVGEQDFILLLAKEDEIEDGFELEWFDNIDDAIATLELLDTTNMIYQAKFFTERELSMLKAARPIIRSMDAQTSY